jgi:hypothetical protein
MGDDGGKDDLRPRRAFLTAGGHEHETELIQRLHRSQEAAVARMDALIQGAWAITLRVRL